MILFLYYYHVFLSWIKNLLSNKRQTTKAVCLLTEWNRWGGNPTSLLRPLGRDGCLFRPQIPFGIVYSFNNLIIQYIILMSSILRFAPFPGTGLRHLLNPKIPTSRRNAVFFYQILPVFRRSTMKIPTFSNSPIRLKSLIYPEKLDFIAKFNVLTGHFLLKFFWYIVQ